MPVVENRGGELTVRAVFERGITRAADDLFVWSFADDGDQLPLALGLGARRAFE